MFIKRRWVLPAALICFGLNACSQSPLLTSPESEENATEAPEDIDNLVDAQSKVGPLDSDTATFDFNEDNSSAPDSETGSQTVDADAIQNQCTAVHYTQKDVRHPKDLLKELQLRKLTGLRNAQDGSGPTRSVKSMNPGGFCSPNHDQAGCVINAERWRGNQPGNLHLVVRGIAPFWRIKVKYTDGNGVYGLAKPEAISKAIHNDGEFSILNLRNFVAANQDGIQQTYELTIEAVAHAVYRSPSLGRSCKLVFNLDSPLVFSFVPGKKPTTTPLGTRPIRFDLNADGTPEKVGWVSPDTPLLAIDRNHDHTINNGSELFGNHSPLTPFTNAKNGFLALKTYDLNDDDKIDASDPAWKSLLLWYDRNSDGVSQRSELIPVSQKITAISTRYNSTKKPSKRSLLDNDYRYAGKFWAKESCQSGCPIYDVFFATSTSNNSVAIRTDRTSIMRSD